MTATAADYRTALEAILADDNVDSALALFVPPLGVRQEDVAESIVAVAPHHAAKPVLAVLMGRDGLPQGRAELHRAGIPAYIFPESAARGLAALHRHREWLSRPVIAPPTFAVDSAKAAGLIAQARTEGRARLSEPEALGLLEAYGIPVARYAFARTPDEAAQAAARMGVPVAVKIVAPDIIHKTDVGGVRLALSTPVEVATAAAELLEAGRRAGEPQGVLVQEMVRGGRETIVGLSREPGFGPFVMFGLGGVFVEALHDVVFRLAPIHTLDAHDMLRGIRGAVVLEGFRGVPPADLEALADVLLRVSQLATDHPEIAELDVNPLLAFPDGVRAVDARVLLAPAPD